MAGWQKKVGGRWTKWFSSITVLALCFISAFGDETSEPVALQAQLQEEQLARQAAEQRVAELSLALVRTERELEKQRSRNAELQLGSRKSQEELGGLQVRVAALLLEDAKASSDEAVASVLAGLQSEQDETRALTQSVRRFNQSLSPILDALTMSESLRGEIRDRMTEVMRACDRLDALPSLVARRGGTAGPRECRVLSVNPELSVIALDAGSSAGVRPGTWWQVLNQDQVVARVRVIDVRSGLSAAQVVEGSLDGLSPGMSVRRQQ